MQFIITAHDGANMLEKRMEVRQRHLENLGRIKGKVICGGGMLDDEGKPKGSVLVMEFPNRELLNEYLSGEPYVVERVWEKVEVEAMNVVIVNDEKVGI